MKSTRHRPAQRAGSLQRAGRRSVGTGHGPADPHRRVALDHGPGGKGRHRPRHVGRRPVLLQRRRHAGPGPLPQRGRHARRRRHRSHDLPRPAALPATEGLADRITFTLADVCDTGLPGGQADFVWGEDAWCYVATRRRLIAEAARLVKPGGTIAFTDWVEGRAAAERRGGPRVFWPS